MFSSYCQLRGRQSWMKFYQKKKKKDEMKKLTGTLMLLLVGLLDADFRFTNAATLELSVEKTLDNGEALPDDKTARIKVSYDCNEGSVNIGEITVTPPSSLQTSDVTLYFANEMKNILQVTVTDHDFTGILYDVPHDSTPMRRGVSPLNESNKGNRIFTIDKNWFPKNANKISASLEDQGAIYNFYGLKNYPISIPDTMVVENFRNITCAAA